MKLCKFSDLCTNDNGFHSRPGFNLTQLVLNKTTMNPNKALGPLARSTENLSRFGF